MTKEIEKTLAAKIELYLGYVGQLEKIVEVSKVYDNKVMNKKFVDLVSGSVGDVYVHYHKNYYGYSNYEININSALICEYSDNTIFYNRDCKEGDDTFVINNRFNFAKFAALVEKRIDYYKNKVGQMQGELKNGAELLEKYNSLIMQATSIAENFSYEFQEIVKRKGGLKSHCGLMAW